MEGRRRPGSSKPARSQSREAEESVSEDPQSRPRREPRSLFDPRFHDARTFSARSSASSVSSTSNRPYAAPNGAHTSYVVRAGPQSGSSERTVELRRALRTIGELETDIESADTAYMRRFDKREEQRSRDGQIKRQLGVLTENWPNAVRRHKECVSALSA